MGDLASLMHLSLSLVSFNVRTRLVVFRDSALGGLCPIWPSLEPLHPHLPRHPFPARPYNTPPLAAPRAPAAELAAPAAAPRAPAAAVPAPFPTRPRPAAPAPRGQSAARPLLSVPTLQ